MTLLARLIKLGSEESHKCLKKPIQLTESSCYKLNISKYLDRFLLKPFQIMGYKQCQISSKFYKTVANRQISQASYNTSNPTFHSNIQTYLPPVYHRLTQVLGHHLRQLHLLQQ